MELVFEIDKFMSVNQTKQNFVRGKKVITVKTDKYKDWIKRQAIPDIKFGDKFVSVTIFGYHRDKRKRDITNCEKQVLDLLESRGIVDNDCQVKELFIRDMGMIPEKGANELMIIVKDEFIMEVDYDKGK